MVSILSLINCLAKSLILKQKPKYKSLDPWLFTGANIILFQNFKKSIKILRYILPILAKNEHI